MKALKKDKNIHIIESLNIISVYDDNLYDRSDLDMMNSAMRKYVARILKNDGFRFTSGNILESALHDYKIIFPKPSMGLGSTPWDQAIATKKLKQDYLVLTPTQLTGYCLENLELIDALEIIEELIQVQPVNLLKISDHLDANKRESFKQHLPKLRAIAKEVRNRPGMKKRSHIGRKI